jgi:DNA-binding Lrp family transcriptional regulator
MNFSIWRRVKQLEDTKIIKGYGVLLDRKKINLGVMVFIRVSIDSHSEKEAKKFVEEVTALDYVVAC